MHKRGPKQDDKLQVLNRQKVGKAFKNFGSYVLAVANHLGRPW